MAESSLLPDAQTLYDRAACGLLLTDRDGTIRKVNQTFCQWLGTGREQLLGQRFQNLLTMGARIFHQTHWEPLLQMQGSIAEVKLDLQHPDGHTIPMLLNAVSRPHAGATYQELSLFVAEDRHKYERELMRARKQAEHLLAQNVEAQAALAMADARLRMALDTAQLYIWEVDPITAQRRYDPGVALLLGLGAPQAVDVETFLAAIPASDRERATEAFGRMLDATTDTYRASYRLDGADGVQRTVQATARALLEEGGKVRHIVGLLQDITELSRQRAAAEDRALFAEQMIGIVSHDLRNPLTAIMLGAGSLDSDQLAPRQRRVLGHIDQSARRAQRMVAELLDFTMARMGRGLPIRVEPLDLHRTVAACLAELAQVYPHHALEHRSEGPGSCNADADRLYQLIGNLVANAVAYGAPNEPITVVSRVDQAQFSVSVQNIGPPISPALQATLFQPMVRGTDLPSSARSVGLGLYIVREIARAHGGSVGVTSSGSQRTTFTAVVPMPVTCVPQEIPATPT